MEQTLIFSFKFQKVLKLKNDANQNYSNLYAKEIQLNNSIIKLYSLSVL